jgi:uncharacterized protein
MSLTVDVRDLVGAPGTARTIQVAEPIPGLSLELARVPEDQIIDVRLVLDSVVEGILASGPVNGVMALTCARCLKPFESAIHVDVQEMFASDASPEDDEYPLVDGMIDLGPMIRDAVILAMPFAPLCTADCLGLCPRCGADRNEGECTCPPAFDVRWAPLMDLDRDAGSLYTKTEER